MKCEREIVIERERESGIEKVHAVLQVINMTEAADSKKEREEEREIFKFNPWLNPLMEIEKVASITQCDQQY